MWQNEEGGMWGPCSQVQRRLSVPKRDMWTQLSSCRGDSRKWMRARQHSSLHASIAWIRFMEVQSLHTVFLIETRMTEMVLLNHARIHQKHLLKDWGSFFVSFFHVKWLRKSSTAYAPKMHLSLRHTHGSHQNWQEIHCSSLSSLFETSWMWVRWLWEAPPLPALASFAPWGAALKRSSLAAANIALCHLWSKTGENVLSIPFYQSTTMKSCKTTQDKS